MSEHLDEYAVRIQKVEQLKQANIPPYANQFKKTESIEDLYTRKEETNLPPADLLLSE